MDMKKELTREEIKFDILIIIIILLLSSVNSKQLNADSYINSPEEDFYRTPSLALYESAPFIKEFGMKKCLNCGLLKNDSDFYKNVNQCKSCLREKSSIYYKENKDRKKIKGKQYYNENKEKVISRVKAYLKTEKGARVKRKAKKKYYDANYYKEKTHMDVYYAIKRGGLIKEPCVLCGEKKVHGHHRDYNKPLEVDWLCNKHHNYIHRLLKTLKDLMEGE